MNCDPVSLMTAAKCFRCIPAGSLPEVISYLMCQWANKGGAPQICGPPTNIVQITGAGTAEANQIYIRLPPPDDAVFVAANGWTLTCAGSGAISDFPNADTIYESGAQCPCDWIIGSGIGAGPAPVGQYLNTSPLVVWTPASEAANWIDMNGPHLGDLAAFYATAHIPTVSSIVFSGSGNLKAIAGLQSLPILNTIDVNNNALGYLDCSNCTALATINCQSNALTTLNVTGCTALTTFLFSNNTALVSVYVLTCPALTTITAQNCLSLLALDCTNLTSLTDIDTSGSVSFSAITLTGCSGLAHLHVSACALTTLDITDCISIYRVDADIQIFASLTTVIGAAGKPGLWLFDCSGNSVSVLDISGCPALVELDCYNTGLTSLNVTGCVLLQYFNAYQNPGLSSLDLSSCVSLGGLIANDCGLTSIHMPVSAILSSVFLEGNSLPSGPNGVDAVLSNLATNCLTNAGTCDLNTASTNATPTGGVSNADYIALTGAGWSVAIN